MKSKLRNLSLKGRGKVCRAFSLLELSVSIAIIGLMLSGGLVVMSDVVVKRHVDSTETRLDEIITALEAYRVRNGRLPCPASRADLENTANFGKQVNSGDCTYTAAPAGTARIETVASSGAWVLVGVVPTRDLLLRDEYMNNGFGDRITYAVAQPLASSSTFESGAGTITVNDASGNEILTDGAYVLLSHGKSGEGAYRLSSGTVARACGATNLDTENCDADTTFVDAPYNDGSGALAANFFDDHIRWQSNRYYDPVIGVSGGSCIPPDFGGFRADGIDTNDFSGFSTSSGDVNGDGFDDVIIAAQEADPGGQSGAGETYVVFGSASGVPSPVSLSALDGTNGFVINGIDASDYSGYSVSSGDVNGDGFDDVIIGAPQADPGGNSIAGETYVVFGKASGWAASINLSSLNGTTGFVLNGIDALDYSGQSTSSGDVNGDGFDDVIIGAYGGDPNGQGGAGETYVVFGKANGWAASTNLSSLNGTTGFVLNGINASDLSGYSVSSGNINGDGFDDVIIGAYGGDPNGQGGAGETYVVFGKASGWAASTELNSLVGTNGITLNGIDANDQSGTSVSSGDVNGDGFDDVIIGATRATPGAWGVGETYVVFGKASAWGDNNDLSSLDGTTGFVLNGIDAADFSGTSVSSGDVNGDGFDDVIIGATSADPGGRLEAGETYVVLGKASGWAASINLSSLNGTTGFVMNGMDGGNGMDPGDSLGYSTSSGDMNGDGYADVIIGALYADPGGQGNAGETYVTYGHAGSWSATQDVQTVIDAAWGGSCP